MIGGIEILLVEDNEHDADLTIRALKKNKLANGLLHLTDGEKALNFMFAEGEYAGRHIEDRPRVIVLDIHMPKVSGIEVLERLKTDDRTREIPVVVLTSSKEDPDIKRCYALGVNSYVVKPIEFEEFFRAISSLGLFWIAVNEVKR